MITCGSNCTIVCDFCIHYDFNADEQGRYQDKGYCNYWELPAEPYDECDEFHCFRVKENDR